MTDRILTEDEIEQLDRTSLLTARYSIPALLATIRAKDAEIAALRDVVEAAREAVLMSDIGYGEHDEWDVFHDAVGALDAKVKDTTHE